MKVLNKLYQNKEEFINAINAANFDDIALKVFRFQYENCDIYKQYVDLLKVVPESIGTLTDIPFLPISFFKTHKIWSAGERPVESTFESSGTTGMDTSKHYVADEELYKASLIKGFEQEYGSIQKYTVLALLPSYLERSNASLVHMVKVFMELSGKEGNGFYLDDREALAQQLKVLKDKGEHILLIGVTFALLDFAEEYPMDLSGIIVMETGGMKGRREEMTRAQVHSYLQQQFNLDAVHSEYGMTELLSQGYAPKEGIYKPAPTMKVLLRDMSDPLQITQKGQGLINVVDLANIYSCSFIGTDDIGRVYDNGTFEVLGRADHSALRGCSLMAI